MNRFIYIYLFVWLISYDCSFSQTSSSRVIPNNYELNRNTEPIISNINCIDSLKVEDKVVRIFKLLPKLVFEVDGNFYSYEFKNNKSDDFTNLEPYNYIKPFKIHLSNDLSEQLAISWEKSSYGSGGGMNFRGVIIIDFDRNSCLLDEITYQSIEDFPHIDEGSLIYVKKKIVISGKQIKVSKISPERYSDNKELQGISDLQDGEYYYNNHTFKLMKR